VLSDLSLKYFHNFVISGKIICMSAIAPVIKKMEGLTISSQQQQQQQQQVDPDMDIADDITETDDDDATAVPVLSSVSTRQQKEANEAAKAAEVQQDIQNEAIKEAIEEGIRKGLSNKKSDGDDEYEEGDRSRSNSRSSPKASSRATSRDSSDSKEPKRKSPTPSTDTSRFPGSRGRTSAVRMANINMVKVLVADLRSAQAGTCDIETNHRVLAKHQAIVNDRFTMSEVHVQMADLKELAGSIVSDKKSIDMMEVVTKFRTEGRADWVDGMLTASDITILQQIDQCQVQMNELERQLNDLKLCKSFMHHCVDRKIDDKEAIKTLHRMFKARVAQDEIDI
jgi:hypothetical protein